MTYKERLIRNKSHLSEDVINYIIQEDCPDDHFLDAAEPEYCESYTPTCEKCWDRESCIGKKSEEAVNSAKKVSDNNIQKAYDLMVGFAHDDKTTDLEEVIGYLGEALDDHPECEENCEPTIKDSGDRTQFESGAVRDMREGKGRCDLMPLEVAADLLGNKEINHDPILLDIATFMYENDTAWLEAALCNFAEKAYDGCIPTMLLEVAKHYEEGAKKYGPDNWRRGIPEWCYIDSAIRHYLKWCRGDTDEPHSKAFVWNLMCCIWEVDYRDVTTKESTDV